MSQASVQNLQEKQVIFYEGDIDKILYKIISGKIAFYLNYGKPGETLLGFSSAPNYFGTTNVLSGTPAACTAVAAEPSMVLQLPEAELETFPKSDPHNAVAAMKAIAGALAASDQKLRTLLSDLRAIVNAGGSIDRLTELVNSFPTDTEPRVIIDNYIPYTPPAAPVVESTVTTLKSTAAIESPEMPEPYLKGHRGYPSGTHPEYKKYLIPQNYTCPHCHHSFSGNRVQASKLIPHRDSAEEKRYDLRVTYDDFEMEWHEIVTCPSCYFSAFESHFKNSVSLYKSRYEQTLARLCDSIAIDFTAEKNLDTVFAQHYLALACAVGFTDSRQIIARIWMNLIRLYKDAGDMELADISEKNALDAYQTVYMEVDLTEGQEQRLCLTVAGILFARGDKSAAREWAIKVRHGSGDHSAYWSMAEQLIQDVRAELAAENS